VPAVDNAALPETAFRSIVADKAHANRMHTSTSIDPTRSPRPDLSVATVPVCQRTATAPEPAAPTPFPYLEAITSRWLASDHEAITAALAHTANGVPSSGC
jgi:hypothetical protein